MTALRPNAQRAKNAILLLWIIVGIYAVSLVSSYLQYDLLVRMGRGEEVSETVLNGNDLREVVIGLLFLAAYIVCGIFFIQWFRRAYYNLHQRVMGLNDSEGWAAGGWFVPIMNLFKPYQIMRELYTRTSTLLTERGIQHEAPSIGLVGGWWAIWLVSGVADRISLRMNLRAETLDELTHATISDMVCVVLGIPAAILAVQVVKGYAGMEPRLARTPSEVDFVFPPTPEEVTVPSPSLGS